jgi:hypothetical protein
MGGAAMSMVKQIPTVRMTKQIPMRSFTKQIPQAGPGYDNDRSLYQGVFSGGFGNGCR